MVRELTTKHFGQTLLCQSNVVKHAHKLDSAKYCQKNSECILDYPCNLNEVFFFSHLNGLDIVLPQCWPHRTVLRHRHPLCSRDHQVIAPSWWRPAAWRHCDFQYADATRDVFGPIGHLFSVRLSIHLPPEFKILFPPCGVALGHGLKQSLSIPSHYAP